MKNEPGHQPMQMCWPGTRTVPIKVESMAPQEPIRTGTSILSAGLDFRYVDQVFVVMFCSLPAMPSPRL